MNAKINNIQALRAFAALAVASFHTGFAFPYMKPFGSFGVDVFFVISGYIMARICEKDSRFFFRRRILRIVPPYWAATLILFVAAFWFPQYMGTTRAAPDELIKSLLFIPFVKSSGLFRPLLFVGWSLNYEMYFYVVLAISLLVFRRYALLLAGTAIVSITLISGQFQNQSIYAKFYGNDISLEFVLGIAAFFVCRAVNDQAAKRLRLPMLFLLVASMLTLILSQSILPPIHLPRFVILGGLSFLLVASASLLSQGGWDTTAAWLVVTGDASYILYLIHTYSEYFVSRVLSRRIHWLATDSAAGYVIALIAVVALSVLIHLKLERPSVVFLNRNFGGKRKSTEFAVKSVA